MATGNTIQFREATWSDNDQLLLLTRLTPMEGKVSICIQREPDFFALLEKRGQPHVIVAEENGNIIGCISIIKEERIVFDQPESFYYLCDLKVHPDHRNKKIATNLCNELHKYLVRMDADLMVTIAAEGNYKVMPILEGKSGIEGGRNLGKFISHLLIPKKKYSFNGLAIDTINESTILDLYSSFYQRYAMHPVIDSSYLNDCFNYVALKNNEPVAAISLYDPASIKQNVLVRVPRYQALMMRLMAPVRRLLKLPELPVPGNVMRILFVKAYSYSAGHEDALLSLIGYSRKIAFDKKYHFLSIGIHEKDGLEKQVNKMTPFRFSSRTMAGSLKINTVPGQLKYQILFEDFSLV